MGEWRKWVWEDGFYRQGWLRVLLYFIATWGWLVWFGVLAGRFGRHIPWWVATVVMLALLVVPVASLVLWLLHFVGDSHDPPE